jgi:DegV family protein with EDD domain
VVDAGAKGFVGMLEGTLRYIEGRPLHAGEGDGEAAATPEPGARPAGAPGGTGIPADPGEGRYCTQVSLRGEDLPDSESIRARLDGVGTSLVVVRAADVARVHVHADDPDDVLERLSALGTVVSRQVEDTRSPRRTRRVAVVTDSSADLPREWAMEQGVRVVPLQVVVGDRSYRDGVDLGPSELLEVLRDPEAPVPTTSQAAPGEFADAYRGALEEGAEEVLAVVLSGAVSGTHESALTGARQVADGRVEVVDSRTGSVALGLMVIRAVELLDAGRDLDEVRDELERIRDRSGFFFTVRDLEGLLRSGRVSRGKAWLGDLLGLRPLLTVDDEGRIVPCGRVRSREAALEEMLERVDGALPGHDRYRLGVVHAGLPDFAGRVERELRERYDPVEVHSQPLTAVIAAHVGAGAWGVCYQIED